MRAPAYIRKDPILVKIEAEIAACSGASGAEVGRWLGLVAARKYRLAELTGERNGYRLYGKGKFLTR